MRETTAAYPLTEGTSFTAKTLRAATEDIPPIRILTTAVRSA